MKPGFVNRRILEPLKFALYPRLNRAAEFAYDALIDAELAARDKLRHYKSEIKDKLYGTAKDIGILVLSRSPLGRRVIAAGFESFEEVKIATQALRGVTINLLAEWDASFVPGQIPILLEMRVKPGGQNHRYIAFLLFLKEVGVNNLFYTVDSSDPVMKLLKRAKKQGIILETIDYSKGTGMWHIIKDPMEILKAKVNRLSPAERRLLGG